MDLLVYNVFEDQVWPRACERSDAADVSCVRNGEGETFAELCVVTAIIVDVIIWVDANDGMRRSMRATTISG